MTIIVLKFSRITKN